MGRLSWGERLSWGKTSLWKGLSWGKVLSYLLLLEYFKLFTGKSLIPNLKILELLPGAELTYFEADWDIHFAITKNRVAQFNKTKAEKSFLGNVH